VAFDDKDGDRFYDVGEGLGGLTVTATSTMTMDAGGYELALPAGSYTVTFSGGGFAANAQQITVGTKNVKLDLIDPAAGIDVPSEPAAGKTITGTSGNDSITATSSNAAFRPTELNDVVNAQAGADTINSAGGDDTINGGGGKDTIDAGAGNDRILVSGTEATTDVMQGGAGTDTLVLLSSTVTLAGLNVLARSIEQVEGGNRAILGNGSSNTFDLSGLTAAPTQLAYVDAAGGNDTLIGSSFADVLRGGTGNDRITAGAGDDVLNGNGGSDTFVFLAGFGDDEIQQFGDSTGNQDVIRLEGYADAPGSAAGFAAWKSAHLFQLGSDVQIALADDTITLTNTNLSSYGYDDFLFA
jgi:Ca2+-binding RTX toxin-like protein